MIVRLNLMNPDILKYEDLKPGKSYMVLGIEGDDYRIRNDNGLPYIFERNLFCVIDGTEPSDWVTDYGDAGEKYSYPPEFNKPGFFEDYFDQDLEAIEIFNQYLLRQSRQSPIQE